MINQQFSCASTPAWGTIVQVDFETTEVDDGDTIRTGNCTLLDAVTPTSQTFTASDEGPFECPFTCEDADGPSMVITYE